MQSAEELIYRLRGGLSYIDSTGIKINYTHPHLREETCIDAIRARDREIVEACKNKIRHELAMGVLHHGMQGKGYWEDAIDSVLRDLG